MEVQGAPNRSSLPGQPDTAICFAATSLALEKQQLTKGQLQMHHPSLLEPVSIATNPPPSPAGLREGCRLHVPQGEAVQASEARQVRQLQGRARGKEEDGARRGRYTGPSTSQSETLWGRQNA